MVERRRLRADPRQQPRPAVRPGAAVRHRRPAGRGLQGPRPGLPPLNTTLARRMMEQTSIFQALAGRPRPRARSTWPRSSSCWSASASWSSSSRGIKEIDINPLLASPERLVALDARVVAARGRRRRRRPAPAGHPPLSDASTCAPWTTRGRDATLTIRPIRPEDEPLHGRVPRDALGAERLPALLPRDEAAASASPTSG